MKNRKLKSGVTVTDDTQLKLSAIKITQNSELVYSPVRSSDRPIAAKAMTPMAVAPNSGHWFCATTSRTTSSLSLPASMPTLIPSMTMIALSVSMQRAMISAPSEMRSISRSPFMYITKNVPMIVRNSTMPMIKPVLRPIAKSSTTKTIVTALRQVEHELAGGCGHRFGLKVDLADLDADRLIALLFSEFLPHAFAHRHDVAALHRRDAEADRRLAVVAQQPPRRVLIAAIQRGDVAQEQLPARLVGTDHEVEHVVRRAEFARRIDAICSSPTRTRPPSAAMFRACSLA